MWFASQDGLNRFDGETITVYYGPPTDHYRELRTAEISSLAMDDEDGGYLGLADGSVLYYDIRESEFVRISESSYGPVSGIIPLPGSLLAYVAGDRLHILNGRSLEMPALPFPGGVRVVRSFGQNPDPEYLIIGIDGEVAVLRIVGENEYQILPMQRPTSEPVHCYIPTPDDDFWISPSGIITRRSDSAVIADLGLGEAHRTTCVVYGPHDSLWLGSDGMGLFIVDPDTGIVRRQTSENGLTDDTILSLYADELDTLWLGTWSSGVAYYHSGIVNFDHWTPDSLDLRSPDVMAIEVLSDGSLALGTLGGGVTIHPPGDSQPAAIRLDIASGFPDNNILSLHQDETGILWVGTAANGAYTVDTETWTLVDRFHISAGSSQRISSNRIHDISSIGRSRIALSVRKTDLGPGSLTIIDADSMTIAVEPYEGTVWTVMPSESKEDIIYLGTEEGLLSLDLESGLSQRIYPAPGGGDGQRVWAIHQFSQTSLLLGTRKGAVMLSRDGVEKSWTTRDGLPNNVIYSILGNSDDGIWVSTNKGLSSINPETGRIDNFSLVHGLQDTEYNLNSMAVLDDGRLAMGGVNGLNVFHPDKVIGDAPDIEFYLSEIRILNHSIGSGKEWRGRILLDNSVETASDLVLMHDENEVAFVIGASDYITPDATRYRYRLVGYDSNWVESGNRHYVSYTNLGPGSYEFRYQAKMSTGHWPERFNTLNLEIKPPFASTWTFRLLVLAAAVIILFFILRYYRLLRREIHDRTKAEVKYKELSENLESRVKERSEALVQAHDRLLQAEKLAALGPLMAGIGHEINTPVGIAVTGTSWMREQVSDRINGQNPEGGGKDFIESLLSPLDLVQTNLNRAVNLINSLKTAMMDHGDNELIDTIFPEYIDDVVRSIRIKFKDDDISINCSAGEGFSASVPRSGLWHIITNLIQNSHSHGFPPDEKGIRHGAINIHMFKDDSGLTIDYTDDGKGMTEEVLANSTEPFFTTDRSSGSTGLGMFLIHNIIYKTFNGDMVMESTPGEGVHFVMTIPLPAED